MINLQFEAAKNTALKKCSKMKRLTKAAVHGGMYLFYGRLAQLERLKSQRVVVKVTRSEEDDKSLVVLFT